MEQALGIGFFAPSHCIKTLLLLWTYALKLPLENMHHSSFHHAPVALPAYLHYFSVFHQYGNLAQAAIQFAHSPAGLGIGLNVILDEIPAIKFKPVAHILRVRAPGSSIKLKPGHERSPQTFPASRDRRRPAPPGCAGCNRSAQRWESQPIHGAELLRRRIPEAPPSAACACALLPAP